MHKFVSISLLILIFGGFFSCAQTGDDCVVTAGKVKDAIQSDEIELLDVRTIGEYNSGHAPFSIHLDYYSRSFQEDVLKLDKDKTYYVYCRSGVRSRKAQRYMLNNGFQSVCNIKGGIMDMSRNGVELVK